MSERGRSMQTHHLALSALSLSFVLLVWFVITETGLVSPRFLASPRAIVLELLKMLRDGYTGASLFLHFWASVRRTLVGYLLAVAVGVPLGLLLGSNRVSYYLVTPVMTLLRPIPPIAYIPLVILWLGIGESSKILVIFMSAFLYVVLNTYSGVAQVPEGLIRAAVNLGATRIQLFTRVIFPATLPSIMTGLKTGLAVSWAVVVAAELIAAQQGLGYMIMDASTFFNIPVVYIGILMIGIIGLVMTSALEFIESRALHWAGK